MRSMTGYGVAERDWHGGRFSISVRTVNHRFLDVVVRLASSLRPQEAQMKKLVKAHLSRGRIEVSVDQVGDSSAAAGRLNLQAAKELASLAQELKVAGLVEGERLRAVDFLRFPEIVQSMSGELDLTQQEARTEALLGCLEDALQAVVSSREGEGRAIYGDLDEIVADLEACCERVRGRARELLNTLPSRYADRLRTILESTGAELNGPNVDARLIQEAGILTERVDVSEEVGRLTVHLVAVKEVLGAGGPCGKRLDFLAQELLREFNTVASKCRDALLASTIVDAKVLCERFREQVQNVE